MTVVKNERQEVAQKYKSLNESDRIIFKSVLDMTIVLLKNMQSVNCKTNETKSAQEEKMDKQKINPEECYAFIRLIQLLNETKQAGVLQIIQGAKLLNQSKKQRITRRFRP